MPPNGCSPAVLVILNRNGQHLLPGCLEAVAALSRPPLAVILVDNGSSDGSVRATREMHPEVQILVSPTNLGVSGGRNLGLAAAMRVPGAEWVLFMDNDTTLDPQAVDRLVQARAGDPRVGMVVPKAYRRHGEKVLASAGGMRFAAWRGAAWDVAAGCIDDGSFDHTGDVEAACGFAFFVRRTVLAAVGPFDEAFNPYGWEDVDYSLRVRAAGFRIVYAPDAIVYHAGGRAGRGAVPEYERHKVAKMLYLVRRHGSPLDRLAFLSLLPLRAIYRVGRELASGNPGVVVAWAQGFFAGLGRQDGRSP
jgi:GT2 family glycosyltransferase